MSQISPETLKSQLDWRYATKHFDSTRQIPSGELSILENALHKSPSSFGLQPWRVLSVENKEIRAALRVASWGQAQIEEASHLFVFTTLKKVRADYIDSFIKLTSEVRGTSLADLEQYKQMMLGFLVGGPQAESSQYWAQRQAYLAMGFLLEAAALREIDACPMEGFDPGQYDEILGLTNTDYASVAVVALGYRSKDDEYQNLPKVRFDFEKLFEIRK